MTAITKSFNLITFQPLMYLERSLGGGGSNTFLACLIFEHFTFLHIGGQLACKYGCLCNFRLQLPVMFLRKGYIVMMQTDIKFTRSAFIAIDSFKLVQLLIAFTLMASVLSCVPLLNSSKL